MPKQHKCSCACKSPPSEEELTARLEKVLAEYQKKPGGLIPALQTIQAIYGYLPQPALCRVAEVFDKPLSEVAGVVSFYSFFSTVPRGKYLVRVCLGTACYVRGGKEVLQAIKHRLGIDVGETTPDRLFSLEVGRCFGACGMAPAVMINDNLHQRVKPAKVNALLETCRVGHAVAGMEKPA